MSLCLSLCLLLGCTSSTQELSVDLVTDLVPRVEFDMIVLTIERGDTPVSETRHPIRMANYVEGVRIQTAPITQGEHHLVLTLMLSGSAVVSREVVVEVGVQSQAVTMVVSRDCRGVMCPAGDDLFATTCLGGRCVDPRCTPEAMDLCLAAVCERPADCAVSDCAEPMCSSGVCLSDTRVDLCPGDQYCGGISGCIDLPDFEDASIEVLPEGGVSGLPDF